MKKTIFWVGAGAVIFMLALAPFPFNLVIGISTFLGGWYGWKLNEWMSK
jgi:hypothetical protein